LTETDHTGSTGTFCNGNSPAECSSIPPGDEVAFELIVTDPVNQEVTCTAQGVSIWITETGCSGCFGCLSFPENGSVTLPAGCASQSNLQVVVSDHNEAVCGCGVSVTCTFTPELECNDGADGDGDGLIDGADPDCGGPGETSSPGLGLVVVTAHDSGAGTLTLRYHPACGTTDHTLEFGLLDQVSSYDYSGQLCSLGGAAGDASATAGWSYITESAYFLVVGNNGTIEGSYGPDSNGAERPDDIVNLLCPLDQDPDKRCD
jgi:hypothetical protein